MSDHLDTMHGQKNADGDIRIFELYNLGAQWGTSMHETHLGFWLEGQMVDKIFALDWLLTWNMKLQQILLQICWQSRSDVKSHCILLVHDRVYIIVWQGGPLSVLRYQHHPYWCSNTFMCLYLYDMRIHITFSLITVATKYIEASKWTIQICCMETYWS